MNNEPTAEQRRFRRAILTRVVLYIFAGAFFAWLYAQLAIVVAPEWKLGREWVGITAVAVAILTPLCGTVASFGLWFFEPRPLYRMWRTVRAAFTWRRPWR